VAANPARLRCDTFRLRRIARAGGSTNILASMNMNF
jgi:hypothetical protein